MAASRGTTRLADADLRCRSMPTASGRARLADSPSARSRGRRLEHGEQQFVPDDSRVFNGLVRAVPPARDTQWLPRLRRCGVRSSRCSD
jgi:hypothetical protein